VEEEGRESKCLSTRTARSRAAFGVSLGEKGESEGRGEVMEETTKWVVWCRIVISVGMVLG
jgi:hypothetical protein